MSPVWFLLILLSHFISLPSTLSLSVNISYSFHLPKELGVATPKSAKCCEYQRLPNNDTAELVRPTVFGIGTQKGGNLKHTNSTLGFNLPSGTTTLYAYFQRHPLLHGTTKELHYLDTYRINKTDLEPYIKRWGYNRNSLKKGKQGQPLNGPLFEISPSYILVTLLLPCLVLKVLSRFHSLHARLSTLLHKQSLLYFCEIQLLGLSRDSVTLKTSLDAGNSLKILLLKISSTSWNKESQKSKLNQIATSTQVYLISFYMFEEYF